jgi:hypothetical protein
VALVSLRTGTKLVAVLGVPELGGTVGAGGAVIAAAEGPPVGAVGVAGGRTEPYGVIGIAPLPADIGAAVVAGGAAAVVGVALAADTGAAEAGALPLTGAASGETGACGIGCCGGVIDPIPPAALAPDAIPRAKSPPIAACIARAVWLCTAAGLLKLPAAELASPVAGPVPVPELNNPVSGPRPL